MEKKKVSLPKKVRSALYMYAHTEELQRLYNKYQPSETFANACKIEVEKNGYKKQAIAALVPEKERDSIISTAVWDARQRIAEKFSLGDDVFSMDWR